jgi:hypothetical protein
VAALTDTTHPPKYLVGLACTAAMTSSWTALRLGSVLVGDMLVLCWLIGVVVHHRGLRWLAPVGWLWLASIAAAVAFAVHLLLNGTAPSVAGDLSSNVYINQGAAFGNASDSLTLIRFVLATSIVPALILATGRAQLLAGMWAGSAVLNGAYAVAESFGLTSFAAGALVRLQGPARSSGLSFHPNSFGVAEAMVIPVLLTWAIRRHKLQRLCATAALVVIAEGLLLADSRAALAVGLLAAAVTVMCIAIKVRAYPVFVPGSLVALALLLPLSNFLRHTTRLGEYPGYSDLARAGLRHVAIQLFEESPFYGNGLSDVGAGVMVPLGLLAGGGIVLGAAYYVYAACGLRASILACRGRSTDLALAMAIAFGAFLLLGIWQNSVVERYTYWPIGLALLLRRNHQGLAGSEASGRLDRTKIRSSP